MSFSLVLRRIHLYLALFLTPWVLMYTFSTVYMNHKPRPGKPPVWEVMRETSYDGMFPDGATHQVMARQILTSLEMDGAHQASRRPDGTVVIQRLAAVQPLRLTFTPETRKLVIERLQPGTGAFLERMHRRRGFQHPYGLDDTWAFLVDLFIGAMVFWALSGLWLWWEMKVTRKVGLLVLIGGIALFCFFLAVL